MSIKSIRTGWTGISALAGNDQWFSDFESIASVAVTDSGGVTEVNFTNIPTTYTHLQIRGIWKPRTTSQWTYFRFGNAGTIDTAANYSYHGLLGNGSTAYAEAVSGASATAMNLAYSNNTTYFANFIVDILDYANNNKYKTTRALAGFDGNGSGILGLVSNSWRSLNATTDIRIFVDTANNISQHSHFALYGIRG